MTHFIAIIHEESGSIYGVSFPDLPGVVAAADSLDAALSEAAEAARLRGRGLEELTGSLFPRPRSLDALQADAEFSSMVAYAVVPAVPFNALLAKRPDRRHPGVVRQIFNIVSIRNA
ncbi:MAG TPA: type II toxin-antitoxin system HicB family antitoxin [Methyloceanibacter sp.]|nr:type II toxin-antitoxin system HicB family antitoxin [Methyloceanibacter sp.]